MAESERSDALTIGAIAVFAYVLASVLHEGLGHGGACYITGGKVKLGDPIVAQAEGDTAYVVAPAGETYKQDGKRMAETARMVFALRREGGDWKIASWAWAGRQPNVQGAGAAKPPQAAPAQ